MSVTSNKPNFTIKKSGSQPEPVEKFLYRAKESKARALIIAYVANSAQMVGESCIGNTVFKKTKENFGIQKNAFSNLRTMEYKRWLAEIGNCVDQYFTPRLEHGESWDNIYRSMKPRVYDDGEFCLNFL